MENDLMVLEEENIENLIYEIRGKQVMLDSDLARIYKCINGTKDINKAVNRNIERFPEDFYFQLTEEEIKELSLRFQIGTLNNKGNLRGMHIKYLPYVFTEEGVAMLSSILHTKVAVETSVKIIRAFVKMRHLIKNNIDYFKDMGLIEKRLIIHDNKIDIMDDGMLETLFDVLEDSNFHIECRILKDIIDRKRYVLE